ncbi:MAG: hypothetical protein KDA54_10870 [Phycisphaerales bacterium]|nr:hypothetical protein [Phycisphaerales bacterium]
MTVWRLTIRDDLGACVDIHGDEDVMRHCRDEWLQWREARAIEHSEALLVAKTDCDTMAECDPGPNWSVDTCEVLTAIGISNTADRTPVEYSIPVMSIRSMTLVEL